MATGVGQKQIQGKEKKKEKGRFVIGQKEVEVITVDAIVTACAVE